MRGILLVTVGLAAGTAFAQGLGVTPALPDGVSPLTVTPQAGPWMICAASFSDRPVPGRPDERQARAQAEELAAEIRSRYNLPSYIFNRTADERRAEEERVARLKDEMRRRLQADGLDPNSTRVHVKTVRIDDQYAVLVGGYKDDVTARKALEQIRRLKPSGKFSSFAYVPDPKSGKVREDAISPFQSAFVCRNPTVPVEKPRQDAEVLQRMKEYNAHEPYSLLRAPKPYTLLVKEYRGAASVQVQNESPSAMEKLGFGRKAGEVLNGNAKAAHMTAEVLRTPPKDPRTGQVGVSFDAYVLHAEYNDYVTIGAFDSPDDPKLIQTAQLFTREVNRSGSAVNQLHLYACFMADPKLMAVPQLK
jgi:hypothetical protein